MQIIGKLEGSSFATVRARVKRRNFSSRYRHFAEADAIIVSVPKSGRSWLRVFLCCYFASVEKRPFSLKLAEFDDSETPKVIFTHDLWAHAVVPRLWDRVRGKYLIPPLECQRKRILLLARDPRDVIISLFFELTRRHRRIRYHGELSGMIRHPKFGVERIIDIMNRWIAEWGDRNDFKLVRYEDCKLNPDEVFRELLLFLGFNTINEPAFKSSLDFASFENMKAMEAAGTFNSRKLSPGDIADPESFKVRRGVVGGHREYLHEQDLLYLNNAIAKLDFRFGYASEPSD